MSRKKCCNPCIMSAGKMICNLNRLFYSWIPCRKKRILLYKGDVLGDWIIFLPYLAAIRDHFPESGYKITVIADKRYHPVIQMSGYADTIWGIVEYKGKINYLLKRFYLWIFYYFDIIISASNPPPDYTFVYGKNCLATLRDIRWPYPYEIEKFYQKVIYSNKTDIHGRYLQLLRASGVSGEIPVFDFSCWNKTNSLIPHEKYYVLCAGANDPKRCWEEEKFVRLLDYLQDCFNLPVVSVGSPDEYEKCERIRKNCKNPEKIINLCGKTSLQQLFGIIQYADFMVSNETGPAHISSTLGIKTFIICGGGDYGSFVPYRRGVEGIWVWSIFRKEQQCFRCGWQNPQCRKNNTYRCIAEISVDDVAATICENYG